MGLKLFDDDGDGDSSDEEIEKLNKIEIDQEFARRYEHNKKREDLQRLEELKKKGVIDSESDSDESSSSEEEEAEENAKLSKMKDLEFFDALLRVRNKDPILKNKDAKLFQSESVSENENNDDNKNNDGNGNNGGEIKGNKVKRDGKKKEKKKPMYLKDVVSKQLIEEGPEFEDEEDEEDDIVDKKKVKSYAEEQEELRKAFLESVEQEEAEEEDDGGDFLWEKRKRGGEEEDEEGVGIGEKLDEYFGRDEKLDEDMMFLKDYFRNRMWVGDGDDKKRVHDEGMGLGFLEDEEEIERQEDYEREYNFRFEENAGDRVMGHSRVVEGSVRKKTNARKSQRERKEERMAQAEFERKEELKHLKNVKKKEMMEKLRKIRDNAGVGEHEAWLLDEDDLEEEFNPDEYDKKMKEAFDDGYYKAEDIDPEFGSDQGEDGDELGKPDFDKEDELLGLPEGWDDMSNSRDGFLSARERILKLKESGDNHEQAGDGEDDVVPEVGKRKKKRKRQPSEVEKAVRDQLMEEYYKLDYEDTIGDLKTRFKYKAVNSKRYGLSAEEIFMMDDKELNQYVSIKKLAPYREKEWKVPRIKTYQQRQRNKEVQGNVSTVPKTHTKKLLSNTQRNKELQGDVSTVVAESEKPRPKESSGDTSNLSRHSKRRHRKAELKLSHSRLMAYGKIPSKPKGKKKSRVQDAV